MKTLSQTLEIPLVGVASFDALASAAHRALFEHQMETQKGKPKKKRALEQDSSQILLTLSQCRPGLLYGKIFHRSNEFLAPAQSEWIADIKTHTDAAYSQALSENIEAPLVLCGAGAIEAAEFLQDREESCIVVEIEAAQVAIEMAISGAFKLASGEVTPLDDIAPLYLAPSNAERVREEALAAR